MFEKPVFKFSGTIGTNMLERFKKQSASAKYHNVFKFSQIILFYSINNFYCTPILRVALRKERFGFFFNMKGRRSSQLAHRFNLAPYHPCENRRQYSSPVSGLTNIDTLWLPTRSCDWTPSVGTHALANADRLAVTLTTASVCKQKRDLGL